MTKLEKLRQKKEALSKEVDELESLIKFDNTKESLSAITNGFTDEYLTNTVDENGEVKTEVNKDQIVRKISSGVKDKIMTKNTMMGIADTALRGGVVDNAINLGVAALVGNFAKKNLQSSSWKKKALGFALIYLAPFALKFVREKLEEYQKKKSISSMEKLI